MSTEYSDDKQQQFHDALTYLVDTANINGGSVTLDDIHNAFEDIIEDDAGYEHIYQYLLENKISIKDYIQTSESVHKESDNPDESSADFDEQERRFVNLYKEEVASSSQLTESDIETLLSSLSISEKNSDTTEEYKKNFNHLVEGMLHLVISIAETFENKGVLLSDLIQEGNLGLMEAVSAYISNSSSINASDFCHFTEKHIIKCMEDMVSIENTADRISNHIADNANRLDKASVELSQDLGRTPTIDELARCLSISEDEVERIMKMSLDALNADTAEGDFSNYNE